MKRILTQTYFFCFTKAFDNILISYIIRAVTRSENQDFVPNSEFLPKTFRFSEHISKLIQSDDQSQKMFWILSLLVFSTIKCNLHSENVLNLFWILYFVNLSTWKQNWVLVLKSENVLHWLVKIRKCSEFVLNFALFRNVLNTKSTQVTALSHNPEGTAEGPWR